MKRVWMICASKLCHQYFKQKLTTSYCLSEPEDFRLLSKFPAPELYVNATDHTGVFCDQA